MKPQSLVLPVLVATVLAVDSAPTTAQTFESQRSIPMMPVMPVMNVASVAAGTIEGQITNDRGAPLQGVVISVLGSTTYFAVTDSSGRFVMRSIAPGAYFVRAHRTGYVPSTKMVVDVRSNGRSLYSATLHKSGSEVGTSGQAPPAAVLLAGVGAAAVPEVVTAQSDDASDSGAAKVGDDDHSESGWRLRHLKRSVLKDSTTTVVEAARVEGDRDGGFPGGTVFGKAFESSARFASNLFADFPFSAEVNLLTSSTFDTPLELFSGDGMPTGVAHFLLNGSAGRHAEWSMHGAMTHGDVVSWFVAGSYRTRTPDVHAYDLGLSYSTQRYDGGNPIALAAVGDVSRNAGAVYGYDHWTVSPRVWVDYGARYARYGYLVGPGLFSPRVGVTVQAANRLRVRSLASVRMVAPGAEEFLPAVATGLWVPPERTFAPLSSEPFTAERALHYEVGVERDLGEAYVIALRTFRQEVQHQLVALFGVRMPGRPDTDLGHYFVANGGDFGAHGWGVTFSHAMSQRLRGSVDYSLTTASWGAGASGRGIEASAPSAIRRDTERLHDLTTSLQTEIPQTSTRVVVLYRINSGFTNASVETPQPKLDGRFDVQVNQSLPFLRSSTAQWEVLVAVRNLFREALAEASVYDELLVVRPPKRILGGVMVKF
ncbi:MAG: TonB-dependent receptor [Acidobacteria bacterium]|nr:TonB-dependent receptor [Acidobacteriota bacterium]